MNNQMIELTGSGYEILASPAAQELKLSILKTSSVVKVVNDKPSEAVAIDAASQLASFRKQLEATRKAVKLPVLELGKKIDSVAENFGMEVANEEQRLRRLLGSFQMQLAQEQQRLMEEARKKEAEAQRIAAQAEAQRLKALQRPSVLAEAKAESLENKAMDARVATMELEQVAAQTRVAGASMVWDFTVTDVHSLYCEEPNLVTVEPKRREIIEWAKRQEEQGKPVAIPGVTFKKVPKLTIR